MWTTIRNGVTALAVALALTGCDTGTGPADPTGFDAEGALEDYEVLASVLESSELAALGGLSGRTPFVSPARTDGPHAGPRHLRVPPGDDLRLRPYLGRVSARPRPVGSARQRRALHSLRTGRRRDAAGR